MKFTNTVATSIAALSPEALQKIVQALSAIGFFDNTFPCSIWHLDSAASNHMTMMHKNLSKIEPDTTPTNVCTADGDKKKIFDIGYGQFSSSSPLTLHNVLLVPYLIIFYPSINSLIIIIL